MYLKLCSIQVTLYHVTKIFIFAGENDRVQGAGHGNQINGMKSTETTLLTCGIDDSLKTVSLEQNQYLPADVKLSCQPRGMDVNGDTVVVGCIKEASPVYNNTGHVGRLPYVAYRP
jgi:hypothetical protein